MNEADGFRIEAAMDYGFEPTNDDATEFRCTEVQLLALMKACEQKGANNG